MVSTYSLNYSFTQLYYALVFDYASDVTVTVPVNIAVNFKCMGVRQKKVYEIQIPVKMFGSACNIQSN